MEKCFKLHGFPPGFKSKSKNPMVNQVNVQEDSAQHFSSNTSSVAQFPFTQEQCQQFLTMLGNQMQAAQLSVGNKEVHMANTVINPNPAVVHPTAVSSSANAIPMAGILPSISTNLRHSIFSA